MPQYERTEERARVLDRYPDYAVDIVPAAGRFIARVDDEIVADSERALEVRESFHETVIYFPPEDVRAEYLAASDHRTRCPFKGDASYRSLHLGERRLDNAVWVYESPMAEVAALAGHFAFYRDRVDVTRER